MRAGGHAGTLSLAIADISIASSGHGHFGSDSTVSANIVGSGEVRVSGPAHCSVSEAGLGTAGVRAGGRSALIPRR